MSARRQFLSITAGIVLGLLLGTLVSGYRDHVWLEGYSRGYSDYRLLNRVSDQPCIQREAAR